MPQTNFSVRCQEPPVSTVAVGVLILGSPLEDYGKTRLGMSSTEQNGARRSFSKEATGMLSHTMTTGLVQYRRECSAFAASS